MAAPKVSVAEVIEQPLNEWDEFTGRLEAPESVELRPRVSGYIDRVAFHEGALVKKGDLLFQIDPRPFEAEVKRLEAQLQQARAAQARSVNEAQRGERLRASNAISAELADARTTAAQEAKAAVAATQAQLDAARLNLSFTRITAPIDGRVSRAEVTAGNLVNSGRPCSPPWSAPTRSTPTSTPTSACSSSTSSWPARPVATRAARPGVPRPEQRGRQPAPGPAGLPRQPGQPAYRHHPRPRRVRQRQGRVHPGPLRAPEAGRQQDLRRHPDQDEAVGTDLGKKFVLVLDGDNKTVYRTVEMGPKLEGLRIVRSGLSKGDRIVVNGLQRVRPGMQVDPQKVEMASADTLATLARLRQSVGDSEPPKVAASRTTPLATSRAAERGDRKNR